MSTIEQALAKKRAGEKKVDAIEPEKKIEESVDTSPDPADVDASDANNSDDIYTEHRNSEGKADDIVTESATVENTKVENTAEDTSTNNDKKFLDIDLAELERKQFIVPEVSNKRNKLNEEFRQIKRKLINNAFGPVSKTLDFPNLIMVTSALPNEGKTFISINLALSIALEQDKTVLLVDADILKPSILRECGLTSKPGLIEYLLGGIDNAGDIIYQTNIDKLKIIPAGKPHHLSNELLASERMATLAKELSTRYPDRIVIFDSPPILGVTETPVLARLMGQALIAVEENKTSLQHVESAASLLHEELATGLVLNKSLNSQKETYGYYGYGYGIKAE
ncbi:XrtA-associated tyrosine autokinase [Thalassotalea crassostreae]|uniref:XrtA-associated tyrosine autokinase n=1 Tax=Thalassotalea crassostreae TaxID=1763536 RepID=UPI0008394DFA|nr:XrtA-associated tyrosine autokinase [Thalassotalea crassostreae]